MRVGWLLVSRTEMRSGWWFTAGVIPLVVMLGVANAHAAASDPGEAANTPLCRNADQRNGKDERNPAGMALAALIFPAPDPNQQNCTVVFGPYPAPGDRQIIVTAEDTEEVAACGRCLMEGSAHIFTRVPGGNPTVASFWRFLSLGSYPRVGSFVESPVLDLGRRRLGLMISSHQGTYEDCDLDTTVSIWSLSPGREAIRLLDRAVTSVVTCKSHIETDPDPDAHPTDIGGRPIFTAPDRLTISFSGTLQGKPMPEKRAIYQLHGNLFLLHPGSFQPNAYLDY